MLKYILILCALVVLCYCDGNSNNHNKIQYYPYKKKKHHHFPYHLIYAGFTYLTFLAIKFKIIFFFGTIFAILCAGGKIFAFIKYLEKDKHHVVYDDHGPEKIYVQPPSHGYGFSPGSYPGGFDSYSSGVTLDHPPGGLDKEDSYGPPSYVKGRSDEHEEGEGGLFERFDIFERMMRKVNLTDLAFDTMNMTSTECKKRFVCESDYNVNKTVILKAGYDFLNDESYTKYRTNRPVNSLEECSELYPNCQDYERKTQ